MRFRPFVKLHKLSQTFTSDIDSGLGRISFKLCLLVYTRHSGPGIMLSERDAHSMQFQL